MLSHLVLRHIRTLDFTCIRHERAINLLQVVHRKNFLSLAALRPPPPISRLPSCLSSNC